MKTSTFATLTAILAGTSAAPLPQIAWNTPLGGLAIGSQGSSVSLGPNGLLGSFSLGNNPNQQPPPKGSTPAPAAAPWGGSSGASGPVAPAGQAQGSSGWGNSNPAPAPAPAAASSNGWGNSNSAPAPAKPATGSSIWGGAKAPPAPVPAAPAWNTGKQSAASPLSGSGWGRPEENQNLEKRDQPMPQAPAWPQPQPAPPAPKSE